MFKAFSIVVSFVTILLFGCGNGQAKGAKTLLTASEFAEKMNATPTAPVLDVRTPAEFSKGHLKRALNYDWNGANFDKETAVLDKSKPIFVYCLSGGRSSAAASHLRSQGCKEVYELDGGIMKWRAANLPETTLSSSASVGISPEKFQELITSDKYVLVDFYADWCAPCKKMKPYLDEITKDLAAKVIVIRINADDNQLLCKERGVDALPVLQLYKNKKQVWSNTGYIDKAGVLKHLE